MLRRYSTLLILVALGASATMAQDAEAPTVAVSEHEDWGPHLVDAEGFSLYLYLEDAEVEGSACGENCVNNWPPLAAESGDVSVGDRVDAELVSTFGREDGAQQVVYGEWPLYAFARDQEPGHARGQGLGGAFYLVSPEGEAITEEVATEEEPIDEELMASLMDEGESLFRNNCATCHGDEGQGLVGPGLDGMGALERSSFLISTIFTGRPNHGMPAFADEFSDRQVAAVATFVRNSWDNEFGAVTPEEVAGER